MSLTKHLLSLAASGLLALGLTAATAAAQTDPLPSWNEGAAKTAILDFVARTTTAGSPDFVPEEERIAAFDQDGTLWVEQPQYSQIQFVLDNLPDAVKANPTLAKNPVIAATLAKRALTQPELIELAMIVQSGMTIGAFDQQVRDWLKTARHPRWNRPLIDMTYLPMQEVLKLLRANGYRTFIATGGSKGFVSPYSQEFYGIPPEQIAGTAQQLEFQIIDGRPELIRTPHVAINNIGAGKIENFVMIYGRTPRAQFGNSSADDQQALQYVKNSPGLRLSVAILHDDAKREYAYGPAQGLPYSPIGTFSQEMYDLGKKEGWVIVSMKNDWNRIFSFEK